MVDMPLNQTKPNPKLMVRINNASRNASYESEL